MPETPDFELTLFEKIKKINWPILAASLVFFGILVWAVKADNWANWTGFGKREKVENQTPGKTLWDWLSLLGVPASLAILGYLLQQDQRQRSEKFSMRQMEIVNRQALERQEIADGEAKEEVLQNYFDRLSSLLIDKSLLAIATKFYSEDGDEQVSSEQEELLNAGVDVIRARTLSILRRLENDPVRKASVIHFLIEAEIISKAKLDLTNADLTNTDLRGADLRGANLTKAKLNNADLSNADLSNVDLSNADLSSAIFNLADLVGAKLNNAKLDNAKLMRAFLIEASMRWADLTNADLTSADLPNAYLTDANLSGACMKSANLSKADLSKADLSKANLSKANLSEACMWDVNFSNADLSNANLSRGRNLTDEQLTLAKLCRTTLPDSITLDPNRDCKALGIDPEPREQIEP